MKLGPRQRLVRVAIAEVGVIEKPKGSNTGERVQQYQASTEYYKSDRTGWPWCDAFVQWCCERAGIETDACSASTEATYLMAKAKGWLRSKPVVGAFILWRGVHIGIVVEMPGNGTVVCVEGNHDDRVAVVTRTIGRGEVFVVTPSIEADDYTPRLYYYEDVGAKKLQELKGPWKSEKGRNRKLAKLQKSHPELRARAVDLADSRFGILTGPKSLFGPFDDPSARDSESKNRQKQTGRRMRNYSRPTPGKWSNAVSGDNGKTT